MLTASEAMAELRVSRWTLRELIRSGELDSVTVGERCRHIPESVFNDYMIRLCGEAA